MHVTSWWLKMYCSKCGAQNPDNVSFCSKCGNNFKFENTKLTTSIDVKRGTFEKLDIISEEIEKLGGFNKLGFYLYGILFLLYFSVFTLFIGPIIVYFYGKRGWPRNSLVKAVLYFYSYVGPFFAIAFILMIAAVIAAFVFGMGSP